MIFIAQIITMSYEHSDRFITNKIIRTILHVFFFLSGVAYILNSFLPYHVLQAFKAVPLAVLIILIVPTSYDKGVMKAILGLLCGIAGDEILEYCKDPMYFSIGMGLFLLGHIFYFLSMFDLW
jgi:uncharacterized membrane protein YhhN